LLHHATVFLVIALIAALLGFSGLAGAFDGIARWLALVFAVLALAGFIAGLVRQR
jgi:uncharacterized membrane protein YtjA (UPF0391 family)